MSIAEHITPPKAGLIQVLTLVANTASSAQDTDHSGAGVRYLSVMCDATFYIVFTSNGKSDTTSLPAPVIATTGVGTTVDGRCLGPFALGQVIPFEVGPDERYFRVISVAGGLLRWYLSSPQAG